MRFFLIKSIKARILVWLAIVALPVLATGVFSVQFIHDKLSERIELDLLNASRLEAARIRDMLGNYRASVESLVSNPLIDDFESGETLASNMQMAVSALSASEVPLSDPADSQLALTALSEKLLESAAFADSEISNLMLVAPDLTELGSTPGFSWQPYDTALIPTAMSQGQTLFGNAFLGADGTAQLGMATPIVDRSQRVVGAAVVELRLGPVVDLVVEHEGFGHTSEAHIAQPTRDGDAEFITLMRFARDAAFNKVVPARRDLPINWSLHSPERRIVRSPDYRSVDSILALQIIPETGWGLVVKIDEAEAMQPVIEVQRMALLALAIAVAFIGLFFVAMLGPLSRRLCTMASAAERIADGDYSTRIADSSGDEIGTVSRSFDRMSRALEEETRKRLLVEKKIRHQATHDALTGLRNRASIVELLHLLDTRASSQSHTIVFIDLDGFKPVNDNYGHAAGDCILRAVSRRLCAGIGERGVVGRWGGDEFVVVLPATTVEQSGIALELIDESFEDAIEASGHWHQISCSTGTASNECGCTLTEALERADAKMYRQKQQSKNDPYSRAA